VQQHVDTLVRRQATDEQHTVACLTGLRGVADGIGAAIDYPRASRRRMQLTRRVGRHGQERVEQFREQATPVTALQTMIGDRQVGAAGPGQHRRHAAWQAAHMMRMDDVGVPEGSEQGWTECLGRVPAQSAEGAQRTQLQTTCLAFAPGLLAERDQLALDPGCQGPR
jgi:hypothetical protein